MQAIKVKALVVQVSIHYRKLSVEVYQLCVRGHTITVNSEVLNFGCREIFPSYLGSVANISSSMGMRPKESSAL